MHATTFCSSLVGFTIAACLVMSAPALAEMVSFKAEHERVERGATHRQQGNRLRDCDL